MKHIELIDIVITLLKHKKLIILPTIIVSMLAVVYIMLVPKYWVSTTTFLPATDGSSSLPLIGSQLLGASMSMLGQQSQVESLDMLTIINSRSFSEKMIEKFNLIEYLEIEDIDPRVAMEKALLRLNRSMKKIDLSRETGLITLSIETKDKELSTEIANYYVTQLDRYNTEDRISKARLKREYIEQQLQDVKTKLDSISVELNTFQKENNVINLEKQSEKMLDLYAKLVADYSTIESEIAYQKKLMNPDIPSIRRLEARLELTKQRIEAAEYLEQKDTNKYILNMDDVPDFALRYLQLELSLAIQRKLYEFLYPQLEEAKIMELREMPTIEVIDKAVPAGLRSKPRRAKFCITVFLITIVTFSLLAVVTERIKMLDTEPNKEKIAELKKHLKL